MTKSTLLPRLLLPLTLAALSSGCATMAPKAHAESLKLTPFGESTEAQELNKHFKDSLRDQFANLEPEQVSGLAKEVKVLERSLPAGVSVDGQTVTASPESGLEAVGTFSFQRAFGTPFTFADYQSTGRKVACYPQVPLVWVTLGIWLMVPTAYPCFSEGAVPADQGYGYIRAAAQAAGAQLVVITNLNRQDDQMWGAEGFLFKVRDVPAEAGTKPKDDGRI